MSKVREDIINKGKDWFQFRKGMLDYLTVTKGFKKLKGKPKTQAIGNNTALAPHSPTKFTTMTRI